ncbi:uncharacterized protein LOC141581719 [Saimiri boliviensis]|uniref:uncharacterized protein LOC141581719 n=1 Tax=Saimiri boliviensis TaxID=27679 RepID=UPI003D770E02
MGPKEAKEIMLSKRNCQQNKNGHLSKDIHGVRGGRAGRSPQGEAKAAAGVGGGNRARGGRARGNGPPAGTAAARGCSSTSRSSRWSCSARPGREAAAGPRGRGRARALHNHQLHQLRPPAQRLRLPQGGAGGAEAGSGPGPGGGGTAGPAPPPLPQPALPPRPAAAARAPPAPDRLQGGQAGGRPGGALPPAQRFPVASSGCASPWPPPPPPRPPPRPRCSTGSRHLRRRFPARAARTRGCRTVSPVTSATWFSPLLLRNFIPRPQYFSHEKFRSDPSSSQNMAELPWNAPRASGDIATFSEKRSCFAASVVRACCPVCLGC